MERFRISLAGLTVDVESRYASSRVFFRDYISEASNADICAEVTEAEIAEFMTEEVSGGAEQAEPLAICRRIAEQLPRYGRFLLHGAAVSYAGGGYLFLAPSGTGKSTHIRLWRECIGREVGIVNGDKPIVDVSGAEARICGTPWAGKERWQKNTSVPLRAVCLLRRGETDRIERAEVSEQLNALLYQIYCPEDPKALSDTFSLADRLFRTVPLYVLYCTPTENAVRVSFPVLTGHAYPKGDGQ